MKNNDICEYSRRAARRIAEYTNNNPTIIPTVKYYQTIIKEEYLAMLRELEKSGHLVRTIECASREQFIEREEPLGTHGVYVNYPCNCGYPLKDSNAD